MVAVVGMVAVEPLTTGALKTVAEAELYIVAAVVEAAVLAAVGPVHC